MAGILASLAFTSCSRAEYAFQTVSPTSRAVSAAAVEPPAVAAGPLEASTSKAASSSSQVIAAPFRQAAATLAAAPANKGVTAETATARAQYKPIPQQATKRQQAPNKPAEVSQGVWIGIGVAVLLAILRVATAS